MKHLVLIEIATSDESRYYVNLLTTFPELEGKTIARMALTSNGDEVFAVMFTPPPDSEG